jgi:hypothetical protein
MPLINLILFSYNFWVEPFSSASAFIIVGLRICSEDRWHFNKYFLLDCLKILYLLMNKRDLSKVANWKNCYVIHVRLNWEQQKVSSQEEQQVHINLQINHHERSNKQLETWKCIFGRSKIHLKLSSHLQCILSYPYLHWNAYLRSRRNLYKSLIKGLLELLRNGEVNLKSIIKIQPSAWWVICEKIIRLLGTRRVYNTLKTVI